MLKKFIFLFLSMFFPVLLCSAEVEVSMYLATEKGDGEKVGEVIISESEYGLLFFPNFSNIPAGIHGFHLHENPDCSPITKDGLTTPAGAAGGHYDPTLSKTHKGPYDKSGHLGDLPALYANNDGVVIYPVLAPKLKNLDEIKGRSIMLHVGGDNNEDYPVALGGGGARLACGVIK